MCVMCIDSIMCRAHTEHTRHIYMGAHIFDITYQHNTHAHKTKGENKEGSRKGVKEREKKERERERRRERTEKRKREKEERERERMKYVIGSPRLQLFLRY